jgi:SAM-dependent methyltransferase
VDTINLYDSLSGAYHRAFQVFLDHTDQKATAHAWLDRLVRSLPARRVFVDAGAGNGKVTAWFADAFERTIAIEPNPHLRAEFGARGPSVDLLPETILGASPSQPADLVLCSHVLYYVDGDAWLAHVDRMASWLSPNGVLVAAIQNQDTDCMRMLDRFYGFRFDLRALAATLRATRGDFEVTLETVPAYVTADDFDSAYVVAEFMMNLPPSKRPIPRRELVAYVEETFRRNGNGYRFSCHQDFLRVRRAPQPA